MDIQSSIFPLHRAVGVNSITKPVVRGAPRLELFSAQRVSDVLDRITEAVRVVVGGIDAPGVA